MSAPDPSLAGPRSASVLRLDPATYRPHPLHVVADSAAEPRAWPESNCYTDLWIEILHGLELEPIAAMAFTVAADFEGDQWTFYKFPLVDLVDLYGVDTQELSIWKSPATHALEQARRGRLTLIEVDSYYLPDLTGTTYHREHSKTTVGVETIDLDERRLHYFHNGGFFALQGEDFDGVFRTADPWTPNNPRLLPYTEFVKVDRIERRPAPALAAVALQQLRRWLARAPQSNPFARWKPRFQADLEWLLGESLDAFHLYAFATVRQFGAAFEMAGDFVRWLGQAGSRPALVTASADLTAIAQEAKGLQFKLARAVHAKRTFDGGSRVDELAARWDAAMSALRAAV